MYTYIDGGSRSVSSRAWLGSDPPQRGMGVGSGVQNSWKIKFCNGWNTCETFEKCHWTEFDHTYQHVPGEFAKIYASVYAYIYIYIYIYIYQIYIYICICICVCIYYTCAYLVFEKCEGCEGSEFRGTQYVTGMCAEMYAYAYAGLYNTFLYERYVFQATILWLQRVYVFMYNMCRVSSNYDLP